MTIAAAGSQAVTEPVVSSNQAAVSGPMIPAAAAAVMMKE
jgi:hypothetical protein